MPLLVVMPYTHTMQINFVSTGVLGNCHRNWIYTTLPHFFLSPISYGFSECTYRPRRMWDFRQFSDRTSILFKHAHHDGFQMCNDDSYIYTRLKKICMFSTTIRECALQFMTVLKFIFIISERNFIIKSVILSELLMVIYFKSSVSFVTSYIQLRAF